MRVIAFTKPNFGLVTIGSAISIALVVGDPAFRCSSGWRASNPGAD